MLVLGYHRNEYRNEEDGTIFPPRLPIYGKGPRKLGRSSHVSTGAYPEKTADGSSQDPGLHGSKSRVHEVIAPSVWYQTIENRKMDTLFPIGDSASRTFPQEPR